MKDPDVITGEEILREGLMVDERLYEYDHGRGAVVPEELRRQPSRRRRHSSGELLEALGLTLGDAPHRVPPGLSDEDEQAWEDAWRREFGAAEGAERVRAEVARSGVAEALRERAAPRRRRRYTPDQARAFLRGAA